MLQVNLDKAIVHLKKRGAKKILLQIPEGLKTRAEELASELEENDFEVITIMDPCFGACDIKVSEAKQFNCDALLHVGHNAFLAEIDFPVVYAPLEYKLNKLDELIEKLANYLKAVKIEEVGLVTTVQFINYIEKIDSMLKEKGIKIKLKEGKRTVRGQILGCNYSSVPKTENIVYFGDGLFHPLGVHFATRKNVIMCNPLTMEIKELDKEKEDFLRKRILLIEKAKESDSFGIIVSNKFGQQRLDLAEKVKKDLESHGKKARIFTMEYISEEKLLGLNVGAYVSTACPRLSIDDYKSYKKPIINAFEVKYFWKGYDNYKLDEYY
jgi:2-(3-amino-3-carboxypropyl)histidine synthase